MVRVNSGKPKVDFHKEETNVAKSSQNNVNAQIQAYYNSERQTEVNYYNSKKLKASDLNFTSFPKSNRADAAQFAERSLNEVRDKARDFNADYPDKPYFINEKDFPRPEDFPKKNYGGKDMAYNAWKNAVVEWVEDAKQDMDTIKSTNIADLGATIDMYADEINKKLDRNLFANEMQEGVTRQFIIDTYIALKGNMDAVEAAVHKEAARIRAEVQDVGNGLSMQIDDQSRYLHEHIDDSERNIKNAVMDAKIEVADVVTAESEKTNKNIDEVNQNIDKKSKETQEINALSDAISNAINGVKTKSSLNPNLSIHTERTIQKVENLKQEIVSSVNVTHQTKVELLTELKDLVIRDNWITSADLDQITQRITTINL